MITSRLAVLLLSSISAAALCASGPAAAQSTPTPAVDPRDVETAPSQEALESPEDAGDVVVTGSRIPRRNLETGQPTLVLDSQIIEQRGYNNIADAIQDLPSFGVPGSSRTGQQSGAFGSGQNFINFFGLGSQRTLTIVNGRRFVSSNTASIFGPTGAGGSQVDLNVIPTLLVDRVETIAVGGAPIYGSDAIAGTVNIITKRKFEGIQLDGQYGITERGDAREYRVRGLAGFNFGGGRGNVIIAGEYNKQAGLTLTDRPGKRLNSFFTTPLADSPFDNVLIGDRRIPALSEFGTPVVTDIFPLTPGQAEAIGFPAGTQVSVADASGNPLVFDRAGNLVPLDFGQQTGNLINFQGGNGFVLPGNLLTPVRRSLATALVDYELTDGIRAFAEGWYANSRGNQLRAQPVYNTALFDAAGTPDGNLIISIDNPFLSAAARSTIAASLATNPVADSPDTFYLGRANTDLISGAGASTVELYRFVGGLEGKFDTFGRELTAQLIGNYGRSATQGRERVLVQQNFANALNAVRDASGAIVCAPGQVNAPIPTLSSTCAPINPFGQQISQAARDYVTTTADPRAVNEQWVVTASVAGSLFDLPGGAIGFALGYEHRDEKARFNPGLFYLGQLEADGTRSQFGRSTPIDPVRGGFNTDEFFGELNLPLIGPDQNLPLLNRVELHGAARYIKNSLAGGDWTYTGDARWEPFEGVAFRGNFTRSVRAPSVTELFNPTSQTFLLANDPCDSRFLSGGPNPVNRAANCAAAGLGPNFQSNIVDFTSRGTLSGNPNLRNEKADARTVGVIFRPTFLRGFSATVDWVDIELSGAIESLTATQVLQGCYDSPDYPSELCDDFTRDAAGQITFINTGYANAASRDFQGLVAQVAYQTPTPFLGADSSINLVANYQYTDKLEVRVGAGDLTTFRNAVGYSPHKGTVNATYLNGPFGATLQWLYYGKTRLEPDQPVDAYEFPRVDAVSFFNTSFSVDVNKQFSLRLIVDNVLDENAPFPSTADPRGNGINTYFDGILGRTYRFGASVRF